MKIRVKTKKEKRKKREWKSGKNNRKKEDKSYFTPVLYHK